MLVTGNRFSSDSTLAEQHAPDADVESALLDACSAGDTKCLLNLLSNLHISIEHPDPKAVRYSKLFPATLPPVDKLFSAAIYSGHSGIISTLSSLFPSTSLGWGCNIAAHDAQNAEVLRSCLQHDQRIARYEYNYTSKLQVWR